MFGKPRELTDSTYVDETIVGDFFGDESATAEVVRVDQLHQRVAQVESQITSQFTSLATYAQIAQEQIELARAESRAATERSEHRLTELIERERSDRLEATLSSPGVVSIGAARSAMDERLDSLERSVANIKTALDECFAQQLALAHAINKLFEHQMKPAPSLAAPRQAATDLPAPRVPANEAPARSFPAPEAAQPIPGLSLRLGIA